MRKRVNVNGIYKWVGESRYSRPDPLIEPRVEIEPEVKLKDSQVSKIIYSHKDKDIYNALINWKSESFTQTQISKQANVSNAKVYDFMRRLDLHKFGVVIDFKDGSFPAKEFNLETILEKVHECEIAKGSYRRLDEYYRAEGKE